MQSEWDEQVVAAGIDSENVLNPSTEQFSSKRVGHLGVA